MAIDITDQKLVRAYAHPLRREIHRLLYNRVASPSDLAAELGTPLSRTSYHVKELARLGLVELVNRTATRGAIEHHYTSKVRPIITDEVWAEMPEIVKRAIDGGLLQQSVMYAVAAYEEGGFDRKETYHSRSAGPMDDKGWKRIARKLAQALKDVEKEYEDARIRLAENPDTKRFTSTTVLVHFEGPTAGALARRGFTQLDSEHGDEAGAAGLALQDISTEPAD